MKNSDYSSLSNLIDIIRSKYEIENVIDLLTSVAVVKALSPNSMFSNVTDLNKIINQYYPELKCEEEISSELINMINELNLDYSIISAFLFDYLSKDNKFGVFDLSDELSKELANLIKLPYSGNIASLNCSGISLLREVILQNRFQGNVHLFCKDKMALRLAFLRLYPVKKNIILHLDLSSLGVDNPQKFDFIYYLPRLGFRKNDDLTEMYVSQAKNILEEKGQFLLVSGIDFLSRKENQHNRELILNNFNVDLILSCLGAFLPYSGVPGSFVLFNKGSVNENDIFVAHINLLEKDTFKDLETVIKGYRDHKMGNLVQNASPLMNQVNKEELVENFVVARFDPKIMRIHKGIEEEYRLKRLSDICEVLSNNRQYGPKDYSSKGINSVKYIRVQDLKDGKINIFESKNIERKSDTGVITQPGDLLISVTGTIGKVAIVDEDSSNSLTSNNLVMLRPNKDLVDSVFLLLALQSEYVEGQISKNIHGATIPHLSIMSLRTIRIPVLSLAEQRRIAHRINKLQEELNRLRARVGELEHILQSEIKGLF